MPDSYRYIARCSYGNDSIAMLQYMAEHGLRDVAVVYSDTGWASEEWPDRVERGEAFVRTKGWEPVRLQSIGFEASVRDHTDAGMFPTRLIKFCTQELKVRPFLKWVTQADPDHRAIVCVGVRRAESAARAKHPAFMPERDNGRHVWHPLIEVTDEHRDTLIERAGFEVLPHRSDECAICINSNRADLRRASEANIARVEALEETVGRPMFRPAAYMGASGIREVVQWANSERGKYVPPTGIVVPPDVIAQVESEEPATCIDDWCGR